MRIHTKKITWSFYIRVIKTNFPKEYNIGIKTKKIKYLLLSTDACPGLFSSRGRFYFSEGRNIFIRCRITLEGCKRKKICPHSVSVCPLCPRMRAYFRGRNKLFRVSTGAYIKGGIYPLYFDSSRAYAPYSPQLTPLSVLKLAVNYIYNLCNRYCIKNELKAWS